MCEQQVAEAEPIYLSVATVLLYLIFVAERGQQVCIRPKNCHAHLRLIWDGTWQRAFFGVFMLIFIAEWGDKCVEQQLVVQQTCNLAPYLWLLLAGPCPENVCALKPKVHTLRP